MSRAWQAPAVDQHGRRASSLMVVIWKLVIAVFDVSPFVLPQPEDVLERRRATS